LLRNLAILYEGACVLFITGRIGSPFYVFLCMHLTVVLWV